MPKATMARMHGATRTESSESSSRIPLNTAFRFYHASTQGEAAGLRPEPHTHEARAKRIQAKPRTMKTSQLAFRSRKESGKMCFTDEVAVRDVAGVQVAMRARASWTVPSQETQQKIECMVRACEKYPPFGYCSPLWKLPPLKYFSHSARYCVSALTLRINTPLPLVRDLW